MASGLNRCEFTGLLGADPEARNLPSGGKVVNLRLAVEESWKDKSGEWQKRVEWVPVAIFNQFLVKTAETLKKGDEVLVIGSWRSRKWSDNSGNERQITELLLQNIDHVLKPLVRTRGEQQATQKPQSKFPGRQVHHEDLDDSIPFAPEFR